MRIPLTIAVLLAVVATAVVAVCEHTEIRRLQYRVWKMERRSARLGRSIQRMEAALSAARTPRTLLTQWDGESTLRDEAPCILEIETTPRPPVPVVERDADVVPPALRQHFEGGRR